MKSLLTYFCVGAMALCFVSCGRKGRIIPKSTLADIYAEMLFADQRIMSGSPELRREADTTLFYDPIFKKYGYSFKDYEKTREYYINNPDKYAKLFIKVSGILSENKKHFRKLAEEESDLKEKSKKGIDFSKESVWKRINILWPETPDTLDIGYYVTRKDGFRADNESTSGTLSGRQSIARERKEL